ncbi:SH3 domain-containing protein [Candidatus Electronema sp. TJ]|uniref:SH3 domain-containing protein n=1 Tax=Candidatus Electronema sp. TJ TaxID=3401573 RepID=UPI003AA94334
MKKKSSCLILLLSLALLTLHTAAALAEMVSVSRENAKMLAGPDGKKAKVLWTLGKGFPLKVLKRSGNWIQVKDFENSTGWIHKTAASKEGHMVVKTRKKVNLRSQPSQKGGVVAKAGYGVVFKTLEKKKGWVKVKQDGVTGWVSDTLLWGF